MACWHRQDVAIADVYDILNVIGTGHMGEVTVVQKKDDSASYSSSAPSPREKRRLYACKTVHARALHNLTDYEGYTDQEISTYPKNNNSSSSGGMIPKPLRELLNEIDVLRDLDHPNIIQLFEVYQKDFDLWLVCELCTGGDLNTRLPHLNEEDCVIIMEQITQAVSYMHRRNVCHRDIKLENILFENDRHDAPVKLIDFGMSQIFSSSSKDRKKMFEAYGTVYAIAPEILMGEGYTEQSDVWSLGVVAFVLLSGGDYPFLTEYEELFDPQKRDRLYNAQLVFSLNWKQRNISRLGKEFVAGCLRKHPGSRWPAYEALKFIQDQWIPHLEDLRATTKKGNKNRGISTSDRSRNQLILASSSSNTSVIDTSQSQAEKSNTSSSPSSVSKKDPLENEDKSKSVSFPQANPTHSSTSNLPKKHQSTQSADSSASTPSEEHQQEERRLHRSTSAIRKRTRMKSELLFGLQDFASYGEMKRTILMAIAYSLDKSTLSELRDLFLSLDSHGTGTISLAELRSALQRMHGDKPTLLTEQAIHDLFAGVDYDHSGQIHFVEFVAAVAEREGLITKERLVEVFDRIDSDGKGYIVKNDLRLILGSEYSEELVDRMIDEADYKRNGQVDFDELLRLMCKMKDGEENVKDVKKDVVTSEEKKEGGRVSFKPTDLAR